MILVDMAYHITNKKKNNILRKDHVHQNCKKKKEEEEEKAEIFVGFILMRCGGTRYEIAHISLNKVVVGKILAFILTLRLFPWKHVH